MDFEINMQRFQEDSKKLENSLLQIKDYVGRINQLMGELSTGVRVLIERGALEKTEKKINEDFIGYYRAVKNLESYFGKLADNIKDYDDKINASQQQRMESLRVELKALLASQREEEQNAFKQQLEVLEKQQKDFLEKLVEAQKSKENEAVDLCMTRNITRLMQSMDCDAEKAMTLLKVPKKNRVRYKHLLDNNTKSHGN